MGDVRLSRAMVSASEIATEYASSPVEQPGTQIRTGSSSARWRSIREKTRFSSVRKAAGSLKNAVTGINKSRKSASCSVAVRVRYSAYTCSVACRWSDMRRPIRLRIVLGL